MESFGSGDDHLEVKDAGNAPREPASLACLLWIASR